LNIEKKAEKENGVIHIFTLFASFVQHRSEENKIAGDID
jgi:hypothetical protein